MTRIIFFYRFNYAILNSGPLFRIHELGTYLGLSLGCNGNCGRCMSKENTRRAEVKTGAKGLPAGLQVQLRHMAALLPRCLCPVAPEVWESGDFTPCFEDLLQIWKTLVGILWLFGITMCCLDWITVFGVLGEFVTLSLILHCFISARKQVSSTVLRYSSLRGHHWLGWIATAAAGISCFQLLQLCLISSDNEFLHLKLYLTILTITWLCSWWLFYFHHVRVVRSGAVLTVWWALRPVLNVPRMRTEYLKFGWSKVLLEDGLLLALSIFFASFSVMDRLHQGPGVKPDDEEALIVAEPLLQEGRDQQGEEAGLSTPSCWSMWSFWTFSWVTPLMNLGLQRQLSSDDLFLLPKDLSPEACSDRLWGCWEGEQERAEHNRSLFRAIYNAYGWDYIKLGVLKIVNDMLGFAGPLLLNAIVKYLEAGSEYRLRIGYYCAVGLGATSALRALLGAQYSFFASRIRLQLRASLTAVVYRKALCVSLAERSRFSTGEIQTLMSVDADRVVNMCSSIHDLWSLPLQMAVALYLLYMQVKFAFIAGLAVVILLIPVNRWIALRISEASSQMMKHKDERVRRMGELLMYIRTLKMYTWEQLFAQRVLQMRKQEFQFLSKCKYLDAFCVYFWACTPTLFSLFTFGLYVILGHSLDAATVFTSIALFNILLSPLNSLPWVINGIIEARISLRRVCRFLSCPDLGSLWTKELFNRSLMGRSSTVDANFQEREQTCDLDLNRRSLIVQDADFSWSDSTQAVSTSTLRQICLTVQAGSLAVVLGEVGAGKSSLLEAVLGEMRCMQGTVTSHGSAAFVSQTPWIKSGTVRDNIVFGAAFEPERYQQVLNSCALDVDLKRMQGGDSAEIGERGLNLSGGQKARLALARAVYQNCDIYLLDDPLSAVDAHVAAWLMQHAILGPLMVGKTRILCTHNSQALLKADTVVVMEKGRIKYAGKPHGLGSPTVYLQDESELSLAENSVNDICLQVPEVFRDTGDFGLRGTETKLLDSPYFIPEIATLDKQPAQHLHPQSAELCGEQQRCYEGIVPQGDSLSYDKKATTLVEDEERKEGKVQGVVYWSYANFAGWWVIAIIFASTSLMQASRNAGDCWLAYWVDSTLDGFHHKEVAFYLEVMLLLAVANTIFTFGRAFSFAYGGLRAAYSVHEALLENIIEAPVSFFDRNPRGRILNRFSSDLYTIDDSLPFFVNILLAKWFTLLGITLVLCLVQWTFVVVLVPLSYIYYGIQRYYRATSRELRRLDSVSRSPIYSSFIETLDGAPVIRSLQAQAQFCIANMKLIALNQRASYSEIAASLWLAVRIQMLAAFVVFFISIMAIVGKGNSHLSTATAGLVGLGLSYAAPIITILSELLTSFTETEKEMISIERIQQYMVIPAESDKWSNIVGPHWPTAGTIEFEQVTLAYFPWLPPAVDDVSFAIRAAEKVGVAGRTGAGKSSILNALFRLTGLTSGRILIDGVDTSRISLRRLRSELSVVPQTPFLFEGSIRENLDPVGRKSDAELWEVLGKCHLKDAVAGLDLKVSESGENLSLGQCQLLCLARSLLGRARILCLDECTANVDPHTTALLKETVASECKTMTVITIAHRISTISDVDRVLIMDHGKLVEDGPPQELLADHTSKFYSFARTSGQSGL